MSDYISLKRMKTKKAKSLRRHETGSIIEIKFVPKAFTMRRVGMLQNVEN